MYIAPINTKLYLNIGPIVSSTDLVTSLSSIVYNTTGMTMTLFKQPITGAITATSITPTTGGGLNDFSHKSIGYYEIQVAASQNNTLGRIWLGGYCQGAAPFKTEPVYIVPSNVFNTFNGTEMLKTDVWKWLGVDVGALQGLTDTLTESYVTPGSPPTIEQIFNTLLQRALQFTFVNSTNKLTIFKRDGTTTALSLSRVSAPDIGLKYP